MTMVQSVERTFDILKAVAAHPDGIGATQVSKLVDLPKSTVSRLLSTLRSVEAVESVPGTRRFRIGSGVVSLAVGASFPEYLRNLVRPYLLNLIQATGEAAMLGILDGDRVYYLEQIQGGHMVKVQDWTGYRIPLHFSPSGLLLLAHLREERLEQYLAQPLERFSAQTITDPHELRRVLANIREQGYAWTHEEEMALSSVAAPIKIGNEIPFAAISVFGPTYRYPPEGRGDEISQLVVETGQEIARRMKGYSYEDVGLESV